MSKEDLMKYREEQDRKETEKMFKAIRKNHDKAYNDYLYQEQQRKIVREKQIKEERRINFVLVIVMFLTLLALFGAMVVYAKKDSEEFMHKCTTAGYSENYCRTQL